VLAAPAVLVEARPGWFNRVIEAATPTSAPPPMRNSIWADPRRWPNWWWAALTALGLIVAGVGAAAITLGPVLLWYDRDYLGETVSDLYHLNPHLVGFLQHDRITMAGNMIGIGILYLALAQAMRQGYRWARRALAITGSVTFGSYFYFLGTGGFVEPLHTLVVIVLFPPLVIAVCRPPAEPHWPPVVESSERLRRRALWGQLLMIGVGAGLTVAGVVISVVGFTSVFVPTDLYFMGTHADHLRAGDAHLLPFIAHDRAGFGGALVGAGLAVLLISLWGWRRGQRWLWWCLLLGCASATVPVLVVHFAIGYTHLVHLAPVYLLVVAVAAALALSRRTWPRRWISNRLGPVSGPRELVHEICTRVVGPPL
jgi:drug/metabolite transporter (DMT)-like permease